MDSLWRLLRLVRKGIDRIEEELADHLWTHYAACSDCNNVRYFEGVDFPETFAINPCPSCGVFNQLLPMDEEEREEEKEQGESEHLGDAMRYLSNRLLGKQVPTMQADGKVKRRNEVEEKEEKEPEHIQGLVEYLKKRFNDEIDGAVKRLYMESDRPDCYDGIEEALKGIVADLYKVNFGEELSTFHSIPVYANVKHVTDMLRSYLEGYANYVFTQCMEAENGRD